jgi:hypothetical protein
MNNISEKMARVLRIIIVLFQAPPFVTNFFVVIHGFRVASVSAPTFCGLIQSAIQGAIGGMFEAFSPRQQMIVVGFLQYVISDLYFSFQNWNRPVLQHR